MRSLRFFAGHRYWSRKTVRSTSRLRPVSRGFSGSLGVSRGLTGFLGVSPQTPLPAGPSTAPDAAGPSLPSQRRQKPQPGVTGVRDRQVRGRLKAARWWALQPTAPSAPRSQRCGSSRHFRKNQWEMNSSFSKEENTGTHASLYKDVSGGSRDCSFLLNTTVLFALSMIYFFIAF